MKRVSIIGFGRFGKTLYQLIKDDFAITLYDQTDIKIAPKTLGSNTRVTKDLAEAYASDIIFYAVPISAFAAVIASHKHYFRPDHVLIDVLSVKLHPAEVFERHLATTSTQALLTHPMFGPDSSQRGFTGLSIIVDRYKTTQPVYDFWKDYFRSKQLNVVEMSAEAHDKLAANSQGLTHFLGRLLEEYRFDDTPIDTVGAQKLQEVKQQTIRDSWQLFYDLQHYNPYTKDMRLKLGEAYDKVYNKLLPQQIDPKRLTIGIQGGKGSFNEEALNYWLKRSGIEHYTIKYLYTTDNVLAALHSGDIDHGQFAIHNSIGGIVGESIEAMAAYKFTIQEEFAIKIAHALMIRDDATYADIKQIMAHPQVFAQCKSTLAQKYPQLQQISGEGELIDHANVAKHLSMHKLAKETAVMGSKILATLYNLHIVEDNLQDATENYTSFLLVSR